MDNVISIEGFQFQNYKVGRRRLMKTIDRASIGETERLSFSLSQIGDFLRLARLRNGLAVDEAAALFGLSREELVAIEAGHGEKLQATALARMCATYHVERDFEEFFSYLRSATSGGAKSLRTLRPELERLGLIRPKDW